MRARVFTYCKDCALRNTESCPVAQWATDEDGKNGKYITMGDDYFYCGAGFPARIAFKRQGKGGHNG